MLQGMGLESFQVRLEVAADLEKFEVSERASQNLLKKEIELESRFRHIYKAMIKYTGEVIPLQCHSESFILSYLPT